MALERTAEGLETTLRPKGVARFIAAFFLSIWLCGWAVGETFVVYALMKDTPALNARRPLVTAFLVVWASFWTLGGLLALREWLRLMWSEDRIVVDPEALRIHRRLLAQTSGKTIEITALADRVSCKALERKLSEALGLSGAPADDVTPAGPPEGWTEIVDADGRLAVVQDPAIRAKHAKIA